MRPPTESRPDARDTSNSVGPRCSSRRRRARHTRSSGAQPTQKGGHKASSGASRRELPSMANLGAGWYERRRGRPSVQRSGGRVVSALFFFPRGGSAQVARALCRTLPTIGWEVSLAAGSLGSAGEQGHAPSFFSGVDVVSVDYSPARRLADPTAAIVPFQPSYEDRPGAPDRVFAVVDDKAYERLVAAWSEALARAGAASADVLHLHQLDTGERGCATGLSSRAGGRTAARHRARAAARDRGRRACRLALRRPLGGAPAPVGGGVRAPDRPAGRGGGGRATARRPARARPGAPERGRARAVRAASAGPPGASSPLAALARPRAAGLGRERHSRQRRLPGGGSLAVPRRRGDSPLRGPLHRRQAAAASRRRARARSSGSAGRCRSSSSAATPANGRGSIRSPPPARSRTTRSSSPAGGRTACSHRR
jgi:hypothetical protein